MIAACLGTGCPSLRNEPNEERKRTAIRLTGRQADAEKQEKHRRSAEACAVCDNGWWKCKCNPIALHRLYWGAGSEAAANKQRERRVNGRSQAFNPVKMEQSRRRAIGFRTLYLFTRSLTRSLVALQRLGGAGREPTRRGRTSKMKRDLGETYAHTHYDTHTHTHPNAHA